MLSGQSVDGVEYTTGVPEPEAPAQERPGTRLRRLGGLALLALALLAAVIYFTPFLREEFLPRPVKPRPAPPVEAAAALDTTPSVYAIWRLLDLSALPESAGEELRLGKYFYDRRQPGNFGLAIEHWRKALGQVQEGREQVQSLIASAESELARQFSLDSADAFVLLKQGKRDQAVAL
ncbi:hypothetical protein FJY70_01885, partial [candidate division WOR-3 bacterium]|nr:hypothetical protein [candidate division WOR-3 bacterium]